MPVTCGKVSGIDVSVLRDTGCSGAVVKSSLVKQDEMTGENKACRLIDGTVLHVPIAIIHVDTPYITGQIKVMCMKTPIYDLVIGNIAGARDPITPAVTTPEADIPDTDLVTRARAKKSEKKLKPLYVTETGNTETPMDSDKFQELHDTESELPSTLNKTVNDEPWYEKCKGLIHMIIE